MDDWTGMDDEAQRTAEVQRGQQARELIDHPLMQQFFADMESDLWREFQQAGPGDAPALASIRAALGALRLFRQAMEAHLMTGRLAQEQLRVTRSETTHRINYPDMLS